MAISLSFASANESFVIAHRGNSSVAPENTLAAVRAAVELAPQPRYIEIDLHRSKDGVLTVAHDEDTFRSTGAAGLIRETLFSTLRTLDAGYSSKFGDAFEGEKIPSLEEVLDAVKDHPIGIMIECKQLLLEDDVIDLLRKRGEVEKHVLASFDELTVYRAKRIEPKLKTLYLAGELSPGRIWRGVDVNADILGAHQNSSDEMIRLAQQQGFDVWVWTVNDEAKMSSLFDLPVTGVITDYPEKALEILAASR